MRIAVFGATGHTGGELVKQALDRSHHVTAAVRDPAKLSVSHERLAVVTANMLDSDAVSAALARPFDAVILALGLYHRSPRTDLSDGTRHIINGMKAGGSRRLMVITSLGCGDSAGQGHWLARALQRWSLNYVLEDKNRQEELVFDSGLDWTIIRPPRLTNGSEVRDDIVVWQGQTPSRPKLSWKITRSSLAAMALDWVEQGTHLGEAMTVSEPR